MHDLQRAASKSATIFIGLLGIMFLISAGMLKPGGGNSVVFLNTSYSFGQIKEGTNPSYSFSFTNLGDTSISITGVHSICGCTIPEYSKNPVKPGESGNIVVTYHSGGRPGPFKKSIIVSTDGSPHTIDLEISGIVMPKPLKGTDVTSIGGLAFSVGTVNFGDIVQNERARKNVMMLNNAPYPIKIDSVIHPAHIQVSYPEFPVLTGEKMEIGLNFKPSKNQAGEYDDIITLKTNDRHVPDKIIYLSAFILPKRGKKLMEPVAKFDTYYKNLGNVLQGKAENITFHFSNIGNDTLKVLQVIPSCGCTVVHLSKWSLAPGDSASLEMSTDTWSKFGQIQKDVVVKTNDPQQPEHQLVVDFNVVSHPDISDLNKDILKVGQKAMIFTGKCQSCHVTPGIGKRGKALYVVSCEMCHGTAGKQRLKKLPGIPFNQQFLSSVNEKTLYQFIANGTPDTRKKQMMPGFLQKNGGPLSNEQVLSLVKYLKSLKNQKH